MILDIENIKKSYKNRMILNEVSLKFSTAEIAGILGANGAGKTTLFSILSGLIKPDDGKIKLAEKDITDTKMHKRANAGIVYLPQDTSIFRGLSVEDNIKAILEEAGLTMANVVKTTVFMADMADFADMNAVYAEFFSEPYPARSAVAVKSLPKGALVEIEVVAEVV